MDRLWAIKQDIDPFRVRFFLFYWDWLALLRCTILRCPYCRWIFKITWGPNNSLLGSGERACWHCRQVFWDGSNEWPEMDGEEQRLFLAPITIAGLIGAFLLIPGLILWTSFVVKQPGRFRYGVFFTILGTPLGLWFGFRVLQIMRSVRRYNARGNPGAR